MHEQALVDVENLILSFRIILDNDPGFFRNRKCPQVQNPKFATYLEEEVPEVLSSLEETKELICKILFRLRRDYDLVFEHVDLAVRHRGGRRQIIIVPEKTEDK